jgi:hypothetical protein
MQPIDSFVETRFHKNPSLAQHFKETIESAASRQWAIPVKATHLDQIRVIFKPPDQGIHGRQIKVILSDESMP